MNDSVIEVAIRALNEASPALQQVAADSAAMGEAVAAGGEAASAGMSVVGDEAASMGAAVAAGAEAAQAGMAAIGAEAGAMGAAVAAGGEAATAGMASMAAGAEEAAGGMAAVGEQIKHHVEALIVAAASFHELKQQFTEFVGDSNRLAFAEAATEAVLRSTGDAAGVTAEEVKTLAEDYSNLTTSSAVAVQETENILLRFTAIGKDIFPETIKQVLNVSTAFGVDLTSSARMVGKALEDPVAGMTALRRVGIVFTDDQKAVIKGLVDTGQAAEAQKTILADLETVTGGAAEAAGATLGGQFAILGHQMEAAREQIGGLIAAGIQPLVSAFIALPEPVKLFITLLPAVIAGLTGVAAIMAIVTAEMLVAAAPYVGIALAITALIVVIVEIAKHWDTLTAKFPALATAADIVKAAFLDLWNGIKGTVDGIEQYFSGLGQFIGAWATGVYDIINGVVLVFKALALAVEHPLDLDNWGAVGTAIGTATLNVATDIRNMATGAVTAYSGLGVAAAGAVNGIQQSGNAAQHTATQFGQMGPAFQDAQISGSTLASTYQNLSKVTSLVGVAGREAQQGLIDTANAQQRATNTISAGAAAMREEVRGQQANAQAAVAAGQAFESEAYFVDKLHEAQAAAAGTYQAVLQVQQQFSSQAGEYQSGIDAIAKGQKILDDQYANGQINLADYTKKTDLYSDATARLAGGVQDATLQSADFAAINGEVMKAQDAIATKNPDLVAGTKDWKVAVEQAGEALGLTKEQIDNAMGSTSGLQTTMGGLNDVLGNLITAVDNLTAAINNVPDSKHVNLTMDVGVQGDVSLFQNLMAAGGGAISGTTIGFHAAGGLFTKPTLGVIAEAGPEVLIPLNQLPTAASAKLLAGGTEEGNTLGASGWLPFITKLITDLAGAAGDLGDMVAQAKTFSDAASSAVKLVSDALGLLDALGSAAVDYGPDIAAKIDALRLMTQHAVASLSASASKFNSDGLTAVKDYADAAKSALDVLKQALDLSVAMGQTTVVYDANVEQAIANLKFIAEKATVSIGESAAVMDGGFLAGIQMYADAAKAALDVIKAAVDLVKALADTTIVYGADMERAIANLKFIAEKAAVSIGESAQVQNGPLIDGIAAYTEGAGKAVSLLKDAVDLVKDLADTTIVYGDWQQAAIANLKFIAEKAAVSVGESARVVNGPLIDGIKQYAEGAGAALKLLSDTLSFLKDLADAGKAADVEVGDIERSADLLAERSLIIAQYVAASARTWDTQVTPAVKDYADAVSASEGVLSGTLTLLTDLSAATGQTQLTTEQVAEQARYLAGDSRIIADVFVTVAKDWKAEVNPALKDFADAVSSSTGAAGSVFSFLTNLGDKAGQARISSEYVHALAWHLAEDARIIARVFAEVAKHWSADVNPAMKDFSDAVGYALGPIGQVYDLLGKIHDAHTGTGKLDVTKLAGMMRHDVTVMLGAITDMAADAEPAMRQAIIYQQRFSVVFDLVGQLRAYAAAAKPEADSFLQLVTEIADALFRAAHAIDQGMTAVGASVSAASSSGGAPVSVPALAGGGIVTKPTLALIGDGGPEAVIPLSHGSLHTNQQPTTIENHIHVHLPDGSVWDATVEQSINRLMAGAV